MDGSLTPGRLASALVFFLAMLVSLTFHEMAHALVARLRGDQTAKNAGRLSFNPMAHIDLFGTILLPLVGALTQLPVIGWAKPVPVDTRNLKYPRWDHLLIAAAGPLTNLILASLGLVGLVAAVAQGAPAAGTPRAWIVEGCEAMALVNIGLAVFNLLPIPPLDGAAVAAAFLPGKLRELYMRWLRPYGFFLLLILISTHGLDWLSDVALAYIKWLSALLLPVFSGR